MIKTIFLFYCPSGVLLLDTHCALTEFCLVALLWLEERRDRRTDGRQTVALRFPIGVASVKTVSYTLTYFRIHVGVELLCVIQSVFIHTCRQARCGYIGYCL